MSENKSKQRVRDPLHNLIEFDTLNKEPERAAWEIIQSREFQRLRRIKQLGFSELTYPGATHTRFAHSIGAFHIARRLNKIVHDVLPEKHDTLENVALMATLVHDLGHGPFSHAFENFAKKTDLKLAATHERVSEYLIEESQIGEILNSNFSSGFAKDVTKMIRGDVDEKGNIYRSIVSGKFDADRLDYMRRDRLMTGTEHSAIDFDWLLANLEIDQPPLGTDEVEEHGRKTFVIASKAILAAEAYVMGLFHLYPTVYFHKATRGAEKIFTELMVRIHSLTTDGKRTKTGLPGNHPLIKFCQKPEEIERIIALDDSVIWGSLELLKEAKDPLLEEFAERLLKRRLFKCFDIRSFVTGKTVQEFPPSPEAKKKIDQICHQARQDLENWQQDNKNNPLFLDTTEREAYKKDENESPISVRTSGGGFVDLGQCSNVVGALGCFKVTRAYGCSDTLKKIEKVVENTVQKLNS